MDAIAAGLAAAAAMLAVQSALRLATDGRSWVWVAPFAEEAAKTGLALLLAAPLPATHAVYGAVEAGYDMMASPQRGPAAGVAGMAGHTAFGLLTALVWLATASPLLAWAAAAIAHLGWNALAVRWAEAPRRR